MAAGFTVQNSKLKILITKLSKTKIDPKILVKTQRVDLEIPLELVNLDLWLALQRLEPFGIGNPKPIFKSVAVTPTDIKKIGSLGSHLKFKVDGIDCVWFNAGGITQTTGDLVYSLDENHYNGATSLQLLVKNYG